MVATVGICSATGSLSRSTPNAYLMGAVVKPQQRKPLLHRGFSSCGTYSRFFTLSMAFHSLATPSSTLSSFLFLVFGDAHLCFRGGALLLHSRAGTLALDHLTPFLPTHIHPREVHCALASLSLPPSLPLLSSQSGSPFQCCITRLPSPISAPPPFLH